LLLAAVTKTIGRYSKKGMCNEIHRIWCLAVICVLTTSCSDGTTESASKKYKLNSGAGVFKIRNDLILAVPPEYMAPYEADTVVHIPVSPNQLPESLGGFTFFMPDFSTHKIGPQDYQVLDNDRVIVTVEAADPKQGGADAPGRYPPNMIKRLRQGIPDATAFEDKFGLRCYQPRLPMMECYGPRDASEFILLRVLNPKPDAPGGFLTMDARYFTPRFGGIEILWRTSAKHFARWHDIDSHVWRLINDWNIASAPAVHQ
jgi:hypothetical protein